MVAILEKIEHNTDFHHIADFLKASHIRYALTISPTIYVSHIRQFWSTTRVETTDQETKIIATVDGKPRTISESSLRRHLKLNDEEGISSFPDDELFENLSLMGFNILPNQRTVPLFALMIVTQGEGLTNLTEPHHTPSPQEHQSAQSAYSPQRDSPPLSHQTIIPKPIPHDSQAPTETLTPRRLTKRAIWIAYLDAGQDMENIAKTSAMSHESSPKVPSLDADEGNIWEELGADKSTEKGSNDTEEMVHVLSSMEATNIFLSGGAATGVSPADVFPTAGVPTVNGSFPTVSVIFTTASMATPYIRRSRGITIRSLHPMRIPIISAKDKGKEKVIETKVSKKRKLQEQIDAQSKPSSKKEQRESYMSVLKSHAGWKTKHFSRMTLEQIKEKFIPVWKQWEDFVPMPSKEESKRVKRPGIKLDQGSLKRSTRDKEKELWVELKRLFEPNSKDQLWTYDQAFMHNPLDWKLYDTCGVHHVSTKNQEIFMVVEKDYPLRKGFSTVMISNKLQVEQYSQMASDLILKIHNIANNPR
nr:hypothetical protein [Tanacetum cinerariifolium]